MYIVGELYRNPMSEEYCKDEIDKIWVVPEITETHIIQAKKSIYYQIINIDYKRYYQPHKEKWITYG